jgi:hypothetical protein
VQDPTILNSWKEISNYIGRGVRTVQRWEKDFGLPVRRPSGHLRGSVFAIKGDLDVWLKSCDAREMRPSQARTIVARVDLNRDRFARLRRNTETLKQRCLTLSKDQTALAATLERTAELRGRLRSNRTSS